jgi:hypothetical protein
MLFSASDLKEELQQMTIKEEEEPKDGTPEQKDSGELKFKLVCLCIPSRDTI